MKLKNIFIVSISVLLGFTACDDMNFLQIKPDNLILTDDAVKTVDDLEKLMLGAYQDIRAGGFWGGVALRGFNVISDDAIANTATFEWVQMTTHEMNLVNSVGRDLWRHTYSAINHVNQVAYSDLAEEILASAGDDLEKRFKAEASFIRGFGHFHLVRAFGLPYSDEHKNTAEMGVPVRLRGVMDRETAFEIIQRSTVEEVYNQVISDLEFAVANLPANNAWNSGRATQDIAKAMLAKVYFYKQDYARAAQWASEVIRTGKYELDADMIAKYARAEMGTSTKEVIFMIPSISITEDSWGGLRAFRTNDLTLPIYHPSESLLNAHDKENDRRFATFYKEINSSWYTTRFDYQYMDAIVMGYNELLLLYAEASAESGGDLTEALAALNQIEHRAYGQTKTTQADKSVIIDAARKERRLEIALHGERLFELKRMRQDVCGDAWDSRKVMFQIPDIEQSGNPNVNMN
jgi:tetratricopeptide (TPR) repeat protein